MSTPFMHLKILLPFKIFSETEEVSRIIVETSSGSFGLLPLRLDCVAALTPGILTYQVKSQEEAYLAIDEGVLIKTGNEVFISVRRALGGKNLEELRSAVEKDFIHLEMREQSVRSVLEKMESGFIRRFVEFQNG